MLTVKEDNVELLKRYKNGETNLRDKIFQNNIFLVYSLLNKYKHTGADREDLFQIGSMGLLKAIDNFNPTYNVQFSTYAVPLVLGELKRYFRDSGLIKVSRSLKELSIEINKVKNSFYVEYGRDMTVEELSSKLNVSKYDLIMAMESSYMPSSMEDVIYEKGDSCITIQEAIKDDKDDNLVDLITLQKGLQLLTEKEKLFVKLRYYQEYNQQAIADKFNVSQVQISRLEKQIIEKLKKCF